ncbi:MAG: c-type cytochrome [Porticoccaceae bacterium]
MKPFKLLLICSALALAGCGDKGDADNQGTSPTGQAQDMTSQAMDTAQQTAADAGAATEQAAEQAGEAAEAAAAGAADMADQAATAAGDAAAGAAATSETAPAAAPAADVDLAVGKSVYQSKCMACHATGAAGAPKLDDKANWEPRIAQGMDTLNKHAIEGYKGAKGYMPPKGGFTSLSDDEVKSAVAYMVQESS